MILTSNSQVNKLRDDLNRDIISSSISCLEKTDDKRDLIIFKEHKLLLIPKQNSDLFDAFLKASTRLCSLDENRENVNYISFLINYVRVVDDLKREIQHLLIPFLNRGIRNFIFLISTIFDSQTDLIFQELINGLKEKKMEKDLEAYSANSEFGNHDLIGLSNDTLFALTNLISIYSSIVKNTKIEVFNGFDSEEEEDILSKAIFLASNINCFQHSMDKISFGEWNVKEYKIELNKKYFVFAIKDEKLESSRDLALRRLASQKIIRLNSRRQLASMLEDFALSIYDFSFEYCYQRNSIIIGGHHEKYDSIKRKVLNTLKELSIEDEIIIWNNMDNISIVSSYLSALALNIFAITSFNFSNRSKRHLDEHTVPRIPIVELSSIVNSTKIFGRYAKENLKSFITPKIPEKHLNFFKAPFYESNGNLIIGIDFLSQYNWTEWVRSNLMKGGKTADEIGKSWEVYVSDILKNNHWNNVETGIKLKENGRVLTDIDIVAKREDLLLLIQLKTYHGSGINAYEQWKFRKKLEHAVSQVRIAEAAINNDSEILRNWFREVDLKEIKTIKSIVMTNSHLFNGWVHEGVNIMSVGSLMQIINGANVKFVTENGNILGEKKYIENEVISVKEFIEFIEKPLDWRIGSSEYSVSEHIEIIEDSILHIPILKHVGGINLRAGLINES